MVRIVNLRNYKPIEGEELFKVDRSSPVGNPFFMNGHGDETRDEVCEKYKEYFDRKIQTDPDFLVYIEAIILLAKTHNVALGCWCAPKRCHAETILAYINKRLEEIRNEEKAL